jgi:hypothetical protein
MERERGGTSWVHETHRHDFKPPLSLSSVECQSNGLFKQSLIHSWGKCVAQGRAESFGVDRELLIKINASAKRRNSSGNKALFLTYFKEFNKHF